jgi:hypothetical protein
MIRSSSSTTNPRGKRNARWTGLFERIGIDAGKFPAQTPRMAKKAEAKTATETQRRRVGKQPADAGSLKSGWLGASASDISFVASEASFAPFEASFTASEASFAASGMSNFAAD